MIFPEKINLLLMPSIFQAIVRTYVITSKGQQCSLTVTDQLASFSDTGPLD